MALNHDAVGNLTTVVNAEGATATMSYNKVGQKLTMDDPDLGSWSYAYNRLGNLIRQTDARGKAICLVYENTTNRLVGKHFLTGAPCLGSVSPYDIRYLYDTSGRGPSKGMLTQVQYEKISGYTENYWYDDKGLLSREQTLIPGAAAQDTYYGYDSHNRPYYVQYPDGEKVYTYYNSMGLPSRLWSDTLGYLVDGDAASGAHANTVQYNEAGLPEYSRLSNGTDVWQRNKYHSWGDNNRRFYERRLSTTKGASDLMLYEVRSDFYGNIIKQRRDGGAWDFFCYDDLNRLTEAFGTNTSCSSPEQSYTWHPSGRFDQFEGNQVTYGDSNHVHAATNVATIGSYSYDANGNVKSRPLPGGTQTLSWNHENRLASISLPGTSTSVYTYDADGQRVKKVQGNRATYYVNRYYELEVNGGVRGVSVGADPDNPTGSAYPDELPLPETYDPPIVEDGPLPEDWVEQLETHVELDRATYLPLVSNEWIASEQSVQAAAVNSTLVVKYYFFGGQRIAMSRNGTFRYLHADHLGGTIAETDTAGNRTTWREYTAYGSRRNGTAQLATDRTYTGQQSDETGLMYYNARYYDPAIGHFISPDTIVPNPSNLLDYNQYMYGYGNPVRNVDPSGHANIDTAGFTAGYVETIAPLIDVYDTPARIFDKAGRWVEKHPNYDPSVDPNILPSQKAATSAVYHEYHRNAGNEALAIYHMARQYGMDNPEFSAELAGDLLDNGFGNSFGGPPVLFGPVGTGRGKNRLQPDLDATGPHTTFKRDPNTGEISGYETYQVSDPRNPNPWTSDMRVDLQGASHYDKKTKQYINTPHVHESNGITSPARPNEIPK